MRKRLAALGVLLLLGATACELGGPVATTSTNYCLTGTMANGERVRHGSVAVNSRDWPRRKGEIYLVMSGPNAGRFYEVRDHGPAAQFDMWEPSCANARRYGSQKITIRRVTP